MAKSPSGKPDPLRDACIALTRGLQIGDNGNWLPVLDAMARRARIAFRACRKHSGRGAVGFDPHSIALSAWRRIDIGMKAKAEFWADVDAEDLTRRIVKNIHDVCIDRLRKRTREERHLANRAGDGRPSMANRRTKMARDAAGDEQARPTAGIDAVIGNIAPKVRRGTRTRVTADSRDLSIRAALDAGGRPLADLRIRMHQAMRALADNSLEQHEALRLHACERMSVASIVKSTGMTTKQVRRRIDDAVRFVASYVRDE